MRTASTGRATARRRHPVDAVDEKADSDRRSPAWRIATVRSVSVSQSGFNRVRALHPDWNGFLLLSATDNRVEHEGRRSKGTYELANGRLTVAWENYPPDVFMALAGTYVHARILREIPAAERMFAVSIADKPILASGISVVIPDTNHTVSLRLGGSDIPTFEQIFVHCEYDSPNLPAAADTIVDLGANVGLATVFFGLKYPAARILAVEPEAGNFAAMSLNAAALGDRVRKQHAAVWVNDGAINLHTEDDDGAPLGAWGVQVSDRRAKSGQFVNCHTMKTLLDQAGFTTVDILKVDIEGAELEIFSQGAAGWLPRINLIIVETHDRFRPGSDAAVRQAVLPMFEELPHSGENLFFRRRTT
jgi:FkbM family methyltransferase